MHQSSEELAWIHKPLSQVTTVDAETFINDRLEAVEPGTVDREMDRLKGNLKVATVVWDYPLAKNPMDAVRRPKDFNERDRRISAHEEVRLLEALAQLDFELAVENRLRELADSALADEQFSSNSARKKVLARVCAELRCTFASALVGTERRVDFPLGRRAREDDNHVVDRMAASAFSLQYRHKRHAVVRQGRGDGQ